MIFRFLALFITVLASPAHSYGLHSPFISVKNTVVEGSLTKASADRAINEPLYMLKWCFQRLQILDPIKYKKGKLDLIVNLGPNGKVKQSTIEKSNLVEVRFEKCLKDRASDFNFKSSLGNEGSKVRYTLEFQALTKEEIRELYRSEVKPKN